MSTQSADLPTQLRQDLLKQLGLGVDPLEGFTPDPLKIKKIGWNSDHPWLMETIDELRPKVIFECGVWYGGSAITMANWAKKRGLNTQLIACDTFLACEILRTVSEWLPALEMKFGRPTYWENFYANVFDAKLQDRIIPLHTDTRSGIRFLKKQGIQIDLAHHDATHNLPDVYEDLILLWEIVRPGGVIIVDDYIPENDNRDDCMNFKGVTDGVQRLAKEKGITFDILHPKARLRKPL